MHLIQNWSENFIAIVSCPSLIDLVAALCDFVVFATSQAACHVLFTTVERGA